EKVEDQLTVPLENSLGTISGVENVMSTSAENYSMIQLEFADGTDMNTAMVRVSSALNQIESTLPEGTSTPNIMEISMDMLATMYVAVEREGYDIYQLSEFVDNDVIPYISRVDGVASISTIGLVEKTVQVELNRKKIDKLNDRILEKTDEKLKDAQEKLDDAKEKLDDAQKKLESSQKKFGSTMSSAIFDKLDKQAPGLAKTIKKYIKDLKGKLKELRKNVKQQPDKAEEKVNNAQKKVDKTKKVMDAAKKELDPLEKKYNDALQKQTEAQAALDAYMADPSADPTSEEYKELVAALDEATTAVKKAKKPYDKAKATYDDAAKDYRKAMDKLTTANLEASGVDKERTKQLVTLIDQVIDMLDQAGADVDGSSFNRLITTTRRVSSAISQAISLIQTIQDADISGQLSKVLKQASKSLDGLSKQVDSLPSMLKGLEKMFSGLTQGQLDAAVGFATASSTLSSAQAQLDMAQKQYDDAKEKALENANADALISPKTLSQLIYAQNFAMPVGYIDDKNDNSWLLRVGEEFSSKDQIASALLIDNEIIGVVRLEDIADITIIDNSGESFSRLNSSDSIILCIYKSSSAGTNDVSKACNAALKELEEKYPGTNFVNVMDQGDYIKMIVSSVFQSMIIGAILAIVILALFLRAIKPTIVVAISIPLSVLFAIVLMYFAGLQLNVMTLSGLSLGIGMLVDNSVVVMENIFRLRGLGLPAPRAAVQGAKQVRGAIISSTLTTVCVFLPAVFASGTVK
ncbi:MAG: efflux RND transporter permease subunit, partial [Clostridiales bacterium]|nr:efflux RND transporter permease subunit [Clostridiales bacterium]